VQTIFNHPRMAIVFEKLLQPNRNVRDVYNWLFMIVNGNCSKKDLDFEYVVLNNFNNGQYIGDLMDLLK